MKEAWNMVVVGWEFQRFERQDGKGSLIVRYQGRQKGHSPCRQKLDLSAKSSDRPKELTLSRDRGLRLGGGTAMVRATWPNSTLGQGGFRPNY